MNSTRPVLHHLISIDNLDKNTIEYLLDRAEYFLNIDQKTLIKNPPLSGKIVVNLFFEPSTRTLNSFVIAAERLGATVISPDVHKSSTQKGESLIDTVHTFEAMGISYLVIRHSENNTAEFVASKLIGQTCLINAGDGSNQHPTQALLDLFTIRRHKKNFESLRVCIVGDVAHSRVARSLILGLRKMNTGEIRIAAPKQFIPEDAEKLGVKVYHSLPEGLDHADVIVALRIQKERIVDTKIPDPKKFFKEYGLTPENIVNAKSDAIVMHPGPIMRGIEIDSAVADGKQSVILEQVRNGVAVRMAILDTLLN